MSHSNKRKTFPEHVSQKFFLQKIWGVGDTSKYESTWRVIGINSGFAAWPAEKNQSVYQCIACNNHVVQVDFAIVASLAHVVVNDKLNVSTTTWNSHLLHWPIAWDQKTGSELVSSGKWTTWATWLDVYHFRSLLLFINYGLMDKRSSLPSIRLLCRSGPVVISLLAVHRKHLPGRDGEISFFEILYVVVR